MDNFDNFNYMDRGHGFCWVHKTKPCWIVFYDTTHIPPFYEAYKVKDYLLPLPKKIRNYWTYDNRRLSNGNGFKTIEEAIISIERN